MSAIRNSSTRSQTRKKRTAPYARGLFGNFARFFGFGDDEQTDDTPESIERGLPVTVNHSLNGHAQKPQYTLDNRSPLKTPRASNSLSSALPESSTHAAVPSPEQVANFFRQRTGANVSTNEVESMVSTLQTTQEPERFRFTFTTPGRGASPSFLSPEPNPVLSPGATPSGKKMSKNPNGVYRWEGAGSSKQARQRNRFGSPAFGATPSRPNRPSVNGHAVSAETPASDNKRRKVGDASSSNSGTGPTPPVPFPVTSPTTTRSNGAQRQTSPLPSSRLRTPAKPTAPVNPSPLRQAWSDGSSSSSREADRSSPSQSSRAIQTANFVAGLINETAPLNKPDLSNPYQAASPVGKVGPPRRANKRPRATGRPAAPSKQQKEEEEKQKIEERKKNEEEEKIKAMSAQAIIEATLPKGSKRSRPPAHLESKAPQGTSRASPPRIEAPPTVANNHTVEENDDEEQKRSSKRSKPMINGRGLPSSAKAPTLDVTIEKASDQEMRSPGEGKDNEQGADHSARTSYVGFKPTTLPRGPSKLRFSVQAESSSAESTPPASPPVSVLDISKSTPAPIQTLSNEFNFVFTPATPQKTEITAQNPASEPAPFPAIPAPSKPAQSKPDEIKAQVCALDLKLLPTFDITTSTTSDLSTLPAHVQAQRAVEGLPVNALPKFDLTSTTSSSAPLSTNVALVSTTASAPTKGFDFAAAGLKPPTASNDKWQCGICMLQNPLSATKCTTCDEPRSGESISSAPVTKPVSQGFNWSAAGINAPTTDPNSWKCSVCELMSPKDAAKCTACDEPQPGFSASVTSSSSNNLFGKPTVSSDTSHPATQAFNWSAAGMTAPTTDPNSWKCSVCGLMSPKNATKCTACDEPAPTAVNQSNSSPATMTTSIFGGSSETSSGGFKPSGSFGFTPSSGSAIAFSGFTPSSTDSKPSNFASPSGFKPSGFTPSTSGFTFAPSSTSSSTSLGFVPTTWSSKPVGFASSFGSTPAPSSPPTTTPSLFGSSAPTPSSVTSSNGFDFAAAGMKVPAKTSGTWSCSLCQLSNPESVSKCQTCDEAR